MAKTTKAPAPAPTVPSTPKAKAQAASKGDTQANKAEIDAAAKAKAAQDAAEKAAKDAKKAADKAAADAKKAAEKAAKEAAALKAKADKEAAKAAADKVRADAQAKLDAIKAQEKEARAALRAAGGAGSTKGPDALRAHAVNYVKDNEHKTPAGNPSVHCGDDVATKLAGKSLDEVYAFAAKTLEADEQELREKYAHLNVGMQRMNLGNKIRGVLHAK